MFWIYVNVYITYLKQEIFHMYIYIYVWIYVAINLLFTYTAVCVCFWFVKRHVLSIFPRSSHMCFIFPQQFSDKPTEHQHFSPMCPFVPPYFSQKSNHPPPCAFDFPRSSWLSFGHHLPRDLRDANARHLRSRGQSGTTPTGGAHSGGDGALGVTCGGTGVD